MNPLKFELDSDIDIGTYDIIQNEPEYKKKNSLKWRGALSNLHYKSGSGILSTTGKNIEVLDREISVGDTKFAVSPEALVKRNETISSSNTVITVAHSANGTLWAEEFDYDTIILKTKNKSVSFKPSDNNVIWVSAVASKGSLFVVWEYYENSRYKIKFTKVDDIENIPSPTYIYDFPTSLGSKLTFSQRTYSNGTDSYNYTFGFEDLDLRKRCTINYNISQSKVVRIIFGMGCVKETDDYTVITGEPTYLKQCNNTTINGVTYPNSSFYSYTWNTSDLTVLDNGVLEFDSSTYTTKYASTQASTSFDSSGAASWETINEKIRTGGAQTDTYLGTYPTANVILSSGVCPNNNVNISVCFRDDKHLYYPFRRVGTALSANGYYGTGVVFTFNDYDDIGALVNESGKQFFPHTKFYSNNSINKGKYWDYGPGWSRFAIASIEVAPSTNDLIFLEHPLYIAKIDDSYLGTVSADKNIIYDNNSIESILDFANYDSSNSTRLAAYLDSGTSSKQKLTFMNSPVSVWPSEYVESGTIYWNPCIWCKSYNISDNNLGTYVRRHLITDELISNQEWYWNHNFTSAGDNAFLNQIPFSVKIDDNISAIYYEGICISLAYNKTLLYTPSDLDDKFSINSTNGHCYLSKWNSKNIELSEIVDSSASDFDDTDIEVYKAADYLFTTNIIGRKNAIIESRDGTFELQRTFIAYAMFGTMSKSMKVADGLWMPADGVTQSNDIYYYGAGYNVNLGDESASTSTLLPAITLPIYVGVSQTGDFTKYVMTQRNAVVVPSIYDWFYTNEDVDVFYTHSRQTTDITYKETYYKSPEDQVLRTLDSDKLNTSWWVTGDTVIYPIGVLSKITGINYITSTVDVGNNYYARFYTSNNKTFLSFNQSSSVYYGNQIFTIMSGNYYFDGQAIYYLGSQNDYTQNVFTAYAVGMKFLANSSSEAYFYAPWDKSIYLYTASNTLQKAMSFADVGEVIDSAYSSAEQALYVLFDDGRLWVKTQTDKFMLEVNGVALMTTAEGCQVITNDGFIIYKPWEYADFLPLDVESEWVGDADKLSKFPYMDVVLVNNGNDNANIKLSLLSLNGEEVKEYDSLIKVTKSDWQNQLYRIRITPAQPVGNALKFRVHSDDIIAVQSITVMVEPVSDLPSAPRKARG